MHFTAYFLFKACILLLAYTFGGLNATDANAVIAVAALSLAVTPLVAFLEYQK